MKVELHEDNFLVLEPENNFEKFYVRAYVTKNKNSNIMKDDKIILSEEEATELINLRDNIKLIIL